MGLSKGYQGLVAPIDVIEKHTKILVKSRDVRIERNRPLNRRDGEFVMPKAT